MPDLLTWFITGCSSGFGRALAEAAIAAGHRVIATARDVRSIADLEKTGVCSVAALDVTDAANIREVIAFPKTQSGQDPMTNAPTRAEAKQLDELGIRVLPPSV